MKHYHRWAHLLRCPLDSHDQADCPPHAPYHLSIDGLTQPLPMIGCIIMSMSEWHLGGRGNQPPPSHIWSGSLITDMLQEACPGDPITEAVVLAPGEAILFFGKCLHKEGVLYRKAKNIKLGLMGPVNWAGSTAQVEVTVNTVQEGGWAIMDAIMEKKMKSRGSGHPSGSKRVTQSSTATCNINDWMQDLDEGASGGKWEELMMFALTDMTEVVIMFSMLVQVVDDVGDREHQGILDVSLEAHPLLGVEVLIKEVIKVLCTQQWQEYPAVATDQCVQGEVSEWRSTCQPLRTRSLRMW